MLLAETSQYVGLHPVGIVETLVVGLIVGLLGRAVVPGRQPLGCIFTILIGIGGAVLGSWAAVQLSTGNAVAVVLQVLAAAVLVAIVSAALRR